MLSLLLDENLSQKIASQITDKRKDITVLSLHHWHSGSYKTQTDEAIMLAAGKEGLTFVTCDQKTILPVLVQWGFSGTAHAGVIFMDNRSISQNNIGAVGMALIALWDVSNSDNWTNRVEFLRLA